MSWVKDVDLIASRLSTAFFIRDLAYVVAGAAVVAVPFYAFGLIGEFVKAPWWVIVLMLVYAYCVGFIVQELGVWIPGCYVMNSKHRAAGAVEHEVTRQLKVEHVREILGEPSLLRYHRVTELKHLAAATGSAAWATLFMLLGYYLKADVFDNHEIMSCPALISGALLLVIYGMVARHANRQKADTQAKLIDSLFERAEQREKERQSLEIGILKNPVRR